MRTFTLSIVIGIVFFVCGSAIGLALGGVFVWLNWLPDQKGGLIFAALMLTPGLALGAYGFDSAVRRLRNRQSMRELLERLVLLSAVAYGGLFWKAMTVLVLVEPHSYSPGRTGNDHAVTMAAGLVGLGFLVSLVTHVFLARSISQNPTSHHGSSVTNS